MIPNNANMFLKQQTKFKKKLMRALFPFICVL